jgi:hypothetical protein
MDTESKEGLPLHDALLESVEVLWKQQLCRLHLLAFTQRGKDSTPHVLEFHGVHLVTIPRQDSWGPSSHVNSAAYSSGTFRIEMQSGDIIEVAAIGFTFVAL